MTYHDPLPYGLSAHTPMDIKELRSAMGELGCKTQGEFGRMIGVSRPAVSLWISGKQPVPKSVALLIRMILIETKHGRAHRTNI